MTFHTFFEWLAQTRPSVAMAESIWAFPIVESVHVLGLCLFVGLATLMDLRLLSLVMRDVAVSDLMKRLLPWVSGGFAIMVVSGVLTFLNAPVRYYDNVFFRIKIVALLVAGVNAWYFHSGIWLNVHQWERDAVTPRKARLAGVVSLVLWACIVVAGRMIAYNWFDRVQQ